eukprot:SAG11_NODE_14133_length_624_cov_0.735238_2_plen_106_part_01
MKTAGSVAGVHVVSAVLTWAGYAGSSSILPNGTLAPGVLDFLGSLLAHAGPSSLLMDGTPGMDGIGNPPTYTAASRSATGTMQPQAPWDSSGLHGKVYVIEYDLRT